MSHNTMLRENLRQMIAVLQAERQALAGLDLDAIMGCATTRSRCAGQLTTPGPMLMAQRWARNALHCSTRRGA